MPLEVASSEKMDDSSDSDDSLRSSDSEDVWTRARNSPYEKAHRMSLARVFVPKFPQLPAEIVPTIVAYAFHTGWY